MLKNQKESKYMQDKKFLLLKNSLTKSIVSNNKQPGLQSRWEKGATPTRILEILTTSTPTLEILTTQTT